MKRMIQDDYIDALESKFGPIQVKLENGWLKASLPNFGVTKAYASGQETVPVREIVAEYRHRPKSEAGELSVKRKFARLAHKASEQGDLLVVQNELGRRYFIFESRTRLSEFNV